MIKYKATYYHSPRIEAIEITKETEQSVFFKSKGSDREWREAKVSRDHQWFDSFEEAKTFIIPHFQRRADWANKNLETALALHA